MELVGHEQAPLKMVDLAYIDHFEYDPQFAVTAKFVPSTSNEIIEMATYSGNIKMFVLKGSLHFKIKNQKSSLHVYQNTKLANHPLYGKYYFIPFKDLTSDNSTYGGGRYLDMDKALFNEKHVLLDFNRAYNPWCAYSAGYNCPIPPVDNHLKLYIEAGEKKFNKPKK